VAPLPCALPPLLLSPLLHLRIKLLPGRRTRTQQHRHQSEQDEGQHNQQPSQAFTAYHQALPFVNGWVYQCSV
jgi:hypothetical protein